MRREREGLEIARGRICLGALAAMFIFVAVKFAMSGRFLMIGAFLGVVVVLVATVILSPLGSLVSQRLDNGNSNQGRTNLGTLTITSMASGSPIIGFGSTRNVSGNFNSIAAGSTVKCPRCTPPPLGTQGQFSLVIFSTGIGGIILYLAFFLRMFIGHIRLKTPYAVAALCGRSKPAAVSFPRLRTSALYGIDSSSASQTAGEFFHCDGIISWVKR